LTLVNSNPNPRPQTSSKFESTTLLARDRAANLLPKNWRLASRRVLRRPANALRHEFAVILVVERLRAVTELQIDDARLALRVAPTERFGAFGMRRRNQWRYVGLHPIAPVDFIVD